MGRVVGIVDQEKLPTARSTLFLTNPGEIRPDNALIVFVVCSGLKLWDHKITRGEQTDRATGRHRQRRRTAAPPCRHAEAPWEGGARWSRCRAEPGRRTSASNPASPVGWAILRRFTAEADGGHLGLSVCFEIAGSSLSSGCWDEDELHRSANGQRVSSLYAAHRTARCRYSPAFASMERENSRAFCPTSRPTLQATLRFDRE